MVSTWKWFLSNGDTITIVDHFDGTQHIGGAHNAKKGLEGIRFENGVQLDAEAIKEKMLADASSQLSEADDTAVGSHFGDYLESGAGNDSLTTGEGSDTLDGGIGNDTLDGGKDADEYRYSLGDGNDLIKDQSFGTEQDRLVFGDLNVEDAVFTQNAGEDLVITLTNGETITVKDHFDGMANDIEQIEFC